jgi:hypothetical protein
VGVLNLFNGAFDLDAPGRYFIAYPEPLADPILAHSIAKKHHD